MHCTYYGMPKGTSYAQATSSEKIFWACLCPTSTAKVLYEGIVRLVFGLARKAQTFMIPNVQYIIIPSIIIIKTCHKS